MKGIYTMQLTDKRIITEILTKNGFSFKKSLGQNFLINPTVCPRMAESAVALNEDGVLEIGPGIGVLTAELAKNAKRVVCIEIDERLRPVLNETLSEYSNTEIIFGDCMKLDLKNIIKEKFGESKVSVCANLPYYITSPIIMNLLESHLPITSITVMVQKEAAERICAKVGTREAGAVTVAVNYYSEPKILFNVSRGSFLPAPNVDSTVIRLNVRENPPISVFDEKEFFRFVRASFGQRRKTLVNALSVMYNKDKIKSAVVLAGFDENIRAEKLDMDGFSKVFSNLH